MAYDHAWIEKLAKRFLDTIYSRLKHVIRNGDSVQTYPGCINISFAYVEGKMEIIQNLSFFIRYYYVVLEFSSHLFPVL